MYQVLGDDYTEICKWYIWNGSILWMNAFCTVHLLKSKQRKLYLKDKEDNICQIKWI
jgi:hypothetical protein